MQYFENFETAFRYVDTHPLAMLDSPSLSGKIQKIEFERDLIIYHIQINFKKDYSFIHQQPLINKDYRLLSCYYQPSFLSISILNNPVDKIISPKPCFSYIPKNIPIKYECAKDSEISYIAILFHQRWLFKQLRLAVGRNPQNLQLLKELPLTYFGLLSKIQTNLSKKIAADFNNNESVLTFKSDLYNLLFHFANDHSEQHAARQNQEAIMQMIQKEILSSLKSKMPTHDELASKYYLSPSSLKRHFKEMFGKSIYSYYLEQKMKLAKELLLLPHASISQVANELGYESLSHFSNFFSKHFGVNPVDFKKSESSMKSVV